MSDTVSEALEPSLPRGTPAAEHVAELLSSSSALLSLSLDEARVVVDYMHPQHIAADAVFMREGAIDDPYMLFVLDGEVVVESATPSRVEPQTLCVLGPGQLVGEMRLLTNEPRSASCKANTDILGVVLTQASLRELSERHPRIGLRLVLTITAQIAERLRESNRKFKLFGDLTHTMQQEIHRSIRPPGTPAAAPPA
ncbi:MAG: cyclic nucleotide-binding domain-containing protein [Hylemonella sp.]|nr:cyclic nucleotide-binding domain-containing protein [Hylemonella sp.]MDH5707792.1 cyclic nucleotide-binding domain-containing protein [Hylemonella sp.]